MPTVPPEVAELLRPTERVLWSGAPDPRVLFTASDAYLIPFSVVFLGFAVYWEISVARGPQPLFGVIIGLVFVIAGLYVLVGRFFMKAWAKTRTTYVVTDARALVITHGTVRETPVGTHPLEWRQSGSHLSLTFGAPAARRTINLENTGWLGSTTVAGVLTFFDVADATGLRSAVDEARQTGRHR